VITHPPTDQTVLEHSEVVFKCEAIANPNNISISWLKGNVPLKSIDESGLSDRSNVRSGKNIYQLVSWAPVLPGTIFF